MRLAVALVALLPFLAACAEHVYAPMEEVAARAWTEPGPPRLTLLTAINNRTGGGGHSALMVSGRERVIFDPAGTWRHPTAPERGDVIFGVTPPIYDIYMDYHARPAFRMVAQSIEVSPEMAARAMQLVQAHGAARKATCGISISGILRELGFTEIRRTWYPDRIMHDFAELPGVARTELYDDTEDTYAPGPRAQAAADALAGAD
ncbi:hypothetical protein [uncultured Jannaschia sp.]|uniref:hypothetical protein n=1 Tax=uncultured Jannaschia sp. TaxID=293347 RepID=UPI002626D88C|nr:hypothetical protein [uncultured Jannaschia sp.]